MFSPISPSRRDRKKKGDDYSIVIRDINSHFSVIVRIIYVQRSMNGTNAFLASYAIEYGNMIHLSQWSILRRIFR